jgi:sugar phosphate isomerase/epimerase
MNKLIAFALISILSITASQTIIAQQPQALYTAPLGIESYSFRNSFSHDVASTLDTIKRMGFTEIEGGGNNISAEAFKKLCNERGISIPSTGTSYEQLVKSPDSVALRAEILGAKYVMCAWIPHGKTGLTLELAEKAVEDFNRAGQILRKHGLIFCYHAHGYEFQPYGNGTLLDYIIEHTKAEYVSFEMDILWIQFGGGDPVALLKKYGDRWKLMHLKDLRKGVKKDLSGLTSPDNDVPLGTGEIDIPGILKEAKKVGIAHYFIEDESNYVNLQVPQSIRYLKGLKE